MNHIAGGGMNHPLTLGAPALSPDENLAITLARRLDGSARHVDIGRDTANGLTKLVLALLNVIHELLERQAMRRIDGGSLSEAQAEALGEALMRQALTILELCDQLGITEEDLAIDLGPLGRLAGELT
jgi:cell division protein ZapA (FtsZ GTPase activity inhibitor)